MRKIGLPVPPPLHELPQQAQRSGRVEVSFRERVTRLIRWLHRFRNVACCSAASSPATGRPQSIRSGTRQRLPTLEAANPAKHSWCLPERFRGKRRTYRFCPGVLQ